MYDSLKKKQEGITAKSCLLIKLTIQNSRNIEVLEIRWKFTMLLLVTNITHYQESNLFKMKSKIQKRMDLKYHVNHMACTK